jgi:hypothetical protein
MSASSWALQRAIFGRLTGDAALKNFIGDPPRVYDDAPRDAELPYILIGEARAADWKGVDGGVEHDLKLHVFSRYAGRREIKEIMSAVYDALHEADLAVDGHQLINIRFVFSDAMRRQDSDIYHGVMRFRAVTMPL